MFISYNYDVFFSSMKIYLGFPFWGNLRHYQVFKNLLSLNSLFDYMWPLQKGDSTPNWVRMGQNKTKKEKKTRNFLFSKSS